MNEKPKLIEVSEGKWVNPHFITSVEDNVEDHGRLVISAVGNFLYVDAEYDEKGNKDTSAVDLALIKLGLKK